jgi:hypothetical protein
MFSDTPNLNWHEWMQRWDNQQSGYLPYREQRFTVMLDVLEALLPERFVVLSHHGSHPIVELHEAALRDASFREVGIIWQHLGNRVVMGVR